MHIVVTRNCLIVRLLVSMSRRKCELCLAICKNCILNELMKLEWLDDLIAIIEADSLNEASRKRFLTQPAFTRRIQTIERHVGADLLDRSRKPVRVKTSVVDNEEKIRRIAGSLRELAADLKKGDQVERQLVLGCQHSISTAVAPKIVKVLSKQTSAAIRLRSANRDQCYSLLFSGEVDIVLMYRTKHEPEPVQNQFLQEGFLAEDQLTPIISARSPSANIFEDESVHCLGVNNPGLENETIDLVGYPEDVFLGRLFHQEIAPQLSDSYNLQLIAETALTPAALQFVISGVGVAWVPKSLAQKLIDDGELLDLSDRLPSITLQICAVRLSQEKSPLTESAWQIILSDRINLSQ